MAATARRQAFQAAQEGRFEAALEMTPSSCLQERAVAQFADGSKELHPPVIQHGWLENGPFIDFPFKTSIHRGFSTAMFDYHRVHPPTSC